MTSTKTSIATSFDAIDSVVEKAGIKQVELLCTGKAQAITILSHKRLAPKILPAALQIVNGPDDVEAAIARVASDEGLALAVLRGLALYTQSLIGGTDYDPNDVQKFYDVFRVASEEERHIAAVGTFRMIDGILNTEVARVDAKAVEDAEGEFDNFLKAIADEPVVGVMEAFSDATTFAINLASTVTQAVEAGESIDDARDIFRAIGQLKEMSYGMMLRSIVGAMLEQVLKAKLSPEDFAVIHALAEKQISEAAGELTLH